MLWRAAIIRAGTVLALAGFGALPALAQPLAQAQSLVIGVDHSDPANQQPDQHRLFEYTDFFTRSVTVHAGDTLDFRTAPGAFHVIGLAPSEAAGRAAYPVGSNDTDDPVQAIGTGLPKLEQGPGQQEVVGGSTHGGGTIGQPNNPPTCGVVQMNQQPCTFKGGDDVEDAGGIPGFDPGTNQPTAIDWKITINAPVGKYTYLCWIHPGMTGTVNVVEAGQVATTQAQIDSQSATQFATEQSQALAVEQALSVPHFTGGAAGSRTYQVAVGAATADGKVNLTEMLPQSLALAPGDRVNYLWKSANEVHTVSFPAKDQRLNQPFGFDCGTSFQNPPNGPPSGNGPAFQPCLEAGKPAPELIGDPGTTASGVALTDPTQIVDSGFLVGTGYGFSPSAQQWSIVTNGSTKPGAYVYECSVHEGMIGTLTISAGATTSVAQAPVQIPALMPNTGAGGQVPVWGALALLGLLVVSLGSLPLLFRRR
ncbi:MAG: cupredoxin domain-containing protein [Chloroflexota bacterium]